MFTGGGGAGPIRADLGTALVSAPMPCGTANVRLVGAGIKHVLMDLDKLLFKEGAGRAGYKAAGQATFIFVFMVFLFTLMGVLLAPAQAKTGSTRTSGTIPTHVEALAGFGLLLGGLAALLYGREGFHLVILIPSLTVLLDLDHIPIYLGIAQTIRPAHSIPFIILTVTITAITVKRLDIDMAILSAFMGHLGIDTGQFAPFSPITFSYIQLDPYRGAFLIAAGAAAALAGVVIRARRRRGLPHHSVADIDE